MKLQREGRTQIRIVIPGIVPVDVRPISIGVANIDEVAVSRPLSLLFSFFSLSDLHFAKQMYFRRILFCQQSIRTSEQEKSK